MADETNVVWCEHCRDHFDRDHYDESGNHKIGPEYGPVGADAAAPSAMLDRLEAVLNLVPEGITPEARAVLDSFIESERERWR